MQTLPIESAFNAALANLPPMTSLITVSTKGLVGEVEHSYGAHFPGGTTARFKSLEALLTAVADPEAAMQAAALARVAELKALITRLQDSLPD